jgi:hypothetical protein
LALVVDLLVHSRQVDDLDRAMVYANFLCRLKVVVVFSGTLHRHHVLFVVPEAMM